MKIYLEYREFSDGGWDRFLDRIIRLGQPTGEFGPRSAYLPEEEVAYHMGDVVELTEEEVLDLVPHSRTTDEYLFARFGIRNFDSQPGIPKTGMFSVDDEVYKAIEATQRSGVRHGV